jgi:hypothetical protein
MTNQGQIFPAILGTNAELFMLKKLIGKLLLKWLGESFGAKKYRPKKKPYRKKSLTAKIKKWID